MKSERNFWGQLLHQVRARSRSASETSETTVVEEPPPAFGAPVPQAYSLAHLAEDPYGLMGCTVGHYLIQDRLGGGGMGIVYKARDLHLNRTIALKFLPPQWNGDAVARQRFMQEAQAASSLDHANICTIHDICEAPNGALFIAMGYYEGQTVKELIQTGPIPLDQILNIVIQTASGLAAAHQQQIIHRDVKPANLIVMDEGKVKILDFGLAKLIDAQDLTRSGATMGTVAYMSPEQIQGHTFDFRVDQWALGVVLYEMLAGQRPFPGDSQQAVTYAILNREPAPLAAQRSGIPLVLAHATQRMLRKDPDRRYPSLEAFVAEMKGDSGSASVAISSLPRRVTRMREQAPSIAVLPFVNRSADPDNEYFCDGLTDELIHALTHVGGLRVAARTSTFAFKGQSQDVRTIGTELDVKTVLEGSVQKSGDRVRISVQLNDVATGYHLWSERYDRVIDDIFAIQDEISLAVVDKLKLQLLGQEREVLVRRHTDDVAAYKLYLKGRYQWNQRTVGSLEKAIEYFHDAIVEDPLFGRAFSGMADCWAIMGFYGYRMGKDVFPQAKAAALQALARDENLAEAHVSLGAATVFMEHDWAKAEASFARSLALSPGYANAYHLYAGWVLAPTGRLDEAIRMEQEALKLDPLSPVNHAVLAYIYWWAGRFEEALEQAERALGTNPSFWLTHSALGLIKEQCGEPKAAVQHFHDAIEAGGATPILYGMLGHAQATAGLVEEARQTLADLDTMAERLHVAAWNRALIHLGLGDHDAALDGLEQSLEEQVAWLVYLNVDKRLLPLRGHPRFVALQARIGLLTDV